MINTLNKRILILSTFLVSSSTFAQAKNGKMMVNEFIQSWILPVFLLVLIVTAIGGFIQNFSLIADKSEQGTFWKGIKNVALLVMFVFMGLAVLTAIMVAGNEWSKGIKIG